MSTIDSDFSPMEIENPSPETVIQMLSKMMKIMKEDKKENEVRFVKMQESIDKRMENFVTKFKGSSKDDDSSHKTSSYPDTDEEVKKKSKHNHDKIIYDAEVQELTQNDSGVNVTYRDTKTGKVSKHSAAYCITTIPLGMLAKLKTDLSEDCKEAMNAPRKMTVGKLALNESSFLGRR